MLAPGTQEQASVLGWPEQDGTRRRQVSLGIEVFGDADCVPEDGSVDIVASVDVDAPHELDEFPRLGLAVAFCLVYGFAD
ncbi:MAG: hypothetical protein WKF37_10610 [Bryobacteraceae bacterium]